MFCQKCGHSETEVAWTRKLWTHVARGRKCQNTNCGVTFETSEWYMHPLPGMVPSEDSEEDRHEFFVKPEQTLPPSVQPYNLPSVQLPVTQEVTTAAPLPDWMEDFTQMPDGNYVNPQNGDIFDATGIQVGSFPNWNA